MQSLAQGDDVPSSPCHTRARKKRRQEGGKRGEYLPIAFFHEMEGWGFPSALQSIVISLPEMVLLSNGSDDHLGGSFLL